ncbi:hypothetical protein ACFSX5_13635 [Devosia albogilva]|uniref:Uncharacterized protein n=1 Tax=Devosia albogilva TaxID=429726 RepID=A0ABW5QM50_9HYPH
MPTINHAAAILRWWEQVEANGGVDSVDQIATVSTMLFGCHRWLEVYAEEASPSETSRIIQIRDELEGWLSKRGAVFRG